MQWSGPKLPPGVSATPGKPRKDGSVAWYLYHKATRTKLYAAPGSKELDREVAQAERTGAPAALEIITMPTICDLFENSQEHKRKAASTRRTREHYFKMIRDRFAEYEPRHMADRQFRGDIMDWRDELADTPAAADALVSAIQRLMSWAYDRGKVDYDHTKRIAKLAKSKPRDGKGVSVDQEAALLDCAEPHERSLYLFAMYTLIRQSDLALIGWEHMNEAGWLRWQHTKTLHSSEAISLLPTTALPALDALIKDLPRTGEHMLLTKTGVQWKAVNIRYVWAAWKVRAGLADQDIHFHDIRREGINRLFRAGCTEAEVSSISGHVFGTQSALGDYADISYQLALSAYRKLDRAMTRPAGGADVIPLFR